MKNYLASNSEKNFFILLLYVWWNIYLLLLYKLRIDKYFFLIPRKFLFNLFVSIFNMNHYRELEIILTYAPFVLIDMSIKTKTRAIILFLLYYYYVIILLLFYNNEPDFLYTFVFSFFYNIYLFMKLLILIIFWAIYFIITFLL